jgi:hypothetical protein
MNMIKEIALRNLFPNKQSGVAIEKPGQVHMLKNVGENSLSSRFEIRLGNAIEPFNPKVLILTYALKLRDQLREDRVDSC